MLVSAGYRAEVALAARDNRRPDLEALAAKAADAVDLRRVGHVPSAPLSAHPLYLKQLEIPGVCGRVLGLRLSDTSLGTRASTLGLRWVMEGVPHPYFRSAVPVERSKTQRRAADYWSSLKFRMRLSLQATMALPVDDPSLALFWFRPIETASGPGQLNKRGELPFQAPSGESWAGLFRGLSLGGETAT